EEQTLRDDINFLWNRVEWDFFRKNNENVLYWHWSPDKAWAMNLPVRGWNESLITYVMAASSTTHTIPKEVYDEGWTRNGGMKNGNVYYGNKLPLGPAYGGPLFLSHYSFLTIDPRNLTDQYANYMEQNTAHAKIHHQYSIANPGKFFGYSDSLWGLTASDDPFVGYKAHEPGSNDNGVVSPTAALSSFPFTPAESIKALKFYYYVLGDKLWKNYGFIDAFSLHEPWFADSFLAIDQGPIIIMIENHRTRLFWDLFMSAPEIKAGMRKLGFQSPKL
ncbi:MAG: glucoamylase family protein, partial [Flavitalea sp.]